MSSIIIETPATVFPVSLDQAKNYLRVEFNDDDELITGLIKGATQVCEAFTFRCFVKTGFIMTLDSFPYFTDTSQGQYAYPPAYYSLPRYSTSLWNYSQMIKLMRPPLMTVDRITYLSFTDGQFHDLVPTAALWYPQTAYAINDTVADKNGNLQKCTTAGKSLVDPPATWNKTLSGTTVEAGGPTWTNMGPIASGQFGNFVVDNKSEPARIFPAPGAYWPQVMYVPNAVQIHMTCGYGAAATDVPPAIGTAIMQLVADCYGTREPMAKEETLPFHIKMLLWPYRVLGAIYGQTRG